MRLRFTHGIRRAHAATMQSFLRFAAIMAVLATAIIAVGEALRPHDADVPATSDIPGKNPLAADLARCRDVTVEQLAADDTCRRIWAENRRRFFAPHQPTEPR
jgi:conjugative transfer region protein TrbK